MGDADPNAKSLIAKSGRDLHQSNLEFAFPYLDRTVKLDKLDKISYFARYVVSLIDSILDLISPNPGLFSSSFNV